MKDEHRWEVGGNYVKYDDGLAATQNTKYILVSWLHSGSCFSRELIRENFPECVNIDFWGKTHWSMHSEVKYKYRNAKIFFILSDPRDTAARVGFIENGTPANGFFYIYTPYANENRNSLEFLEENFNKTIELLNYYQDNYGDQCLVLKYEDAYFNQRYFLNTVGNFLKLKPLYIDDIRKYKHSIHKEIGIYDFYYTDDIINDHYNRHSDFYNQWNYPLEGYNKRYYHVDGQLEPLNYEQLLIKNNVNINDIEIRRRIKNIKNF